MKTASGRGVGLLGCQGLLGALAFVATLSSGCTVTPDPCAGYTAACLSVTVGSGPADTYQLLVAVLDGYGSTPPLTPRRRPTTPLLFPLRFAIQFGDFDPAYKGMIRFTVESLDGNGDSTAFVQQSVAIAGQDHEHVAVTLGPSPDLAPSDLAEPDEARSDLSLPGPGDQGSATDLRP